MFKIFQLAFENTDNLYELLWTLYKYDNFTLTPIVIEDVAKELIKSGLYQPMKVSDIVKSKWKQGIELSEIETETVFEDNPQSHKEAGFDKGWASRFDTWFKIAKELGFVYYWQGETIVFSESGKMLLDKDKPENEQMVFVNAFAKYQRDNPFRRVLNKNVPLILLIQTIQYLNEDSTFNGAGISRKELPLLLCWRDDNAHTLYLAIKKLRKEHAYSPSDETILALCDDLLDDVKRDENSIISDYTDDFIRKMRLTGLISVRGGGRFIDINSKEKETVTYILKNYAKPKEYITEKAFFDYIGEVDKELIKNLLVYKSPVRATNTELEKWVNHYKWEEIKAEMLNLAGKKSSKDSILKVIEAPLRLEFLTSLAILKKLSNVTVKPNFISDDEGLPTSFAAGGNPDIECTENTETILVEVTMLTGTQQHIRESYSVQRHLQDFINKGNKAFSLFISPKVFQDTCGHAEYIQFKYKLEVKILDISLFLTQLETNSTLHNVAYTKSSCQS